MKLKTLLTAAFVSLSAASFAQTGAWSYDSIAMGVGYANDVFYDINQGYTSLHDGSDWDLAFQTTGPREFMFNASVRANHVKRGIEVYSLGLTADSKWATVTAADTVGKTSPSMQLINNDSSWGTGAFYQNRVLTNPFSYGWGTYQMGDHSILGNQIYLIKAGANAYKIWLQKYTSGPSDDSIGYTFRIANLDGTNENAVRLYTFNQTAGFGDRLFAYYNIAGNTFVNREPVRASWDLLFTQYRQEISAGPSGTIPYNLTGVLTNLYTEVADIRHLNPDDINATNFKGYMAAKATTRTDEIGADWKTYVNPGPSGYYQLDDSGSFIVKTMQNKSRLNYWQIQFTRFDGGSATGMGKIVFRKRQLASAVGVPAIAAQSLNAFTVAPNPASNDATLMLDAKKVASAQMIVTDMAGRVLQIATLNLKSGINAYSLNTSSWPAGIYAVQVAAQDWKVSSRLVVAH